jgi:hypothetical protein
MKKTSSLFIFVFLISCTSNTIFEKPKDLIPKDTMSLLLQEMMIASSAKFIQNKNKEKNINYMPFVFDKFKIDSTRFDTSNYYYMSEIDIYQEILESAKTSLELRNDVLNNLKTQLDSIKKDSIDCIRINQAMLDSLKIPKKPDSFELNGKKLDTLIKRK